MESLNLTSLLSAVRDRYAKNVGAFELFANFGQLGNGPSVWQWMRAQKGLQMRVLYLTKSNVVRDMIIRQGVHKSMQDGIVAGTGHAMANQETGTLSAWTCVFDGKAVNTGAGFGYRTMKAERILAINLHTVDDKDNPTAIHSQYVTETGSAIISLVAPVRELGEFARAL